MSRPRRAAVLAALPLTLWVGALGVGWGVAADYSARPGPVGDVPARWPADAAPERSPERPTLLVFVHPRCPCSRASLGELEALVADCGSRLDVVVLLRSGGALGDDVLESELGRHAARIPGVRVVADPGGEEARRFGAESSGHALLFAPDGARLFSGGLTWSRGHAGRASGGDAIAALALGDVPERCEAPVFGCGLLDSPTEGP